MIFLTIFSLEKFFIKIKKYIFASYNVFLLLKYNLYDHNIQ